MDMKAMAVKQREDMLRSKWIESEKAGRDLGEKFLVEWPKKYGEGWRVGFYMENLMDLGDGRRPVYFAIFLDQESVDRLKEAVAGIVPEGWKTLCHHCTLSFGDPSENKPLFEYIVWNLGKTVEIDVVTLGTSDDAIAVGVSGSLVTANAIPHVTVAIPTDGKPVNSNKIENWELFPTKLKLKGVVDSFPSHFKWQH